MCVQTNRAHTLAGDAQADAQSTAEEDWADDARGAAVLDQMAFKRCWFQLVDLHTETVSADEYASWSHATLDAITRVRPGVRRATAGDAAPPRETPRQRGRRRAAVGDAAPPRETPRRRAVCCERVRPMSAVVCAYA